MNWKTKKTEPQRFFFDLETLDTLPSATVLSFGIVPFQITATDTFDELVSRGINVLLDKESQIKRGSTVSESTLDWWEQQDQSTREVLADGRIKIPDIIHILADKFPDIVLGKALWYCRGPHFDAAIMDMAFERFNLVTPWSYNMLRDSRTWFDEYPGDWPEKPSNIIRHNSLHDCAYEVTAMQQNYQRKYGETQ